MLEGTSLYLPKSERKISTLKIWHGRARPANCNCWLHGLVVIYSHSIVHLLLLIEYLILVPLIHSPDTSPRVRSMAVLEEEEFYLPMAASAVATTARLIELRTAAACLIIVHAWLSKQITSRL